MVLYGYLYPSAIPKRPNQNVRNNYTLMRCIYILAALLASHFCQAQIKGLILDTDKKPVGSATLTLHRLPDSSLVKTAVSNATGAYSLPIERNGQYYLRVSNVGFTTY